MAMTDKYFSYLNNQVGISPANSEEELQASKTIASLMEAAGLNTHIQDFTTHAPDAFFKGLFYLVVFAGALVSGLGGIAGAIIGLVLVGAAIFCLAATLQAESKGTALLNRILPKAQSQNVIGYHKGVGPKAKSTKRTFVVLAHYDSSHEELLSLPAIARYGRFLREVLPLSVLIVAACAVLNLMLFLPAGLRLAFWIVGLVAALPSLCLGINGVIAKMSALTTAANDNNASLAALFGVAADVAEDPTKITFEDLPQHSTHEDDTSATSDNAEQDDHKGDIIPLRPVSRPVHADPSAIRHGKDMLEELAIFPANTKITYEEKSQDAPDGFDVLSAEDPAAAARERIAQRVAEARRADEDFLAQSVENQIDEILGGTTTIISGPDQARAKEGAAHPVVASNDGASMAALNQAASAGSQEAVGVISAEDGVRPVPESSGVISENVIAAVETAGDSSERSATSEAPQDKREVFAEGVEATLQESGAQHDAENDGRSAQEASGGASHAAFAIPEIAPLEETPDPFSSRQSPGQRAALFDLPDPEQTAIDPLSSGFEYTETHTTITSQSRMTSSDAADDNAQEEDAENNPYASSSKKETRKKADTRSRRRGSRASRDADEDTASAKKSQHRHHARHSHKEEQEESVSSWLGVGEKFDAKSAGERISSWDNFDDDDFWKGGATYSDEARNETEAGANDDELLDAVLGMDTIDLVGHDIYFVAVGASQFNHAGTKAFLKKYQKELRGAYLINLDAVGAGELTVFSKERVHKPKSAARRLVKTLDKVARDLHLNIRVAPQAWKTTEATAAMDKQMRAVTIMGCEVGEVPALVHTRENVAERVDTEQIANVNRLVDETIRRL